MVLILYAWGNSAGAPKGREKNTVQASELLALASPQANWLWKKSPFLPSGMSLRLARRSLSTLLDLIFYGYKSGSFIYIGQMNTLNNKMEEYLVNYVPESFNLMHSTTPY